jgi:hypothetical protein
MRPAGDRPGDGVHRLVDERRAELMRRVDELEAIAAAGEGASTRALELGLVEDELAFLGRVMQALVDDVVEGRTRRS